MKKYLIILLLGIGIFSYAPASHAAITFISSGGASGQVVSQVTPGINTTGASLIVVVATTNSGTSTISDSMNNTWYTLNPVNDGTNYAQIFYAYAPQTNSAQTFTVTRSGSGQYPSLYVSAWAGTLTASNPFDAENGSSTAVYGTSVNTGSITPASTQELIITGFGGGTCYSATNFSLTSGFTFLGIAGMSGCQGDPAGVGYLIDPSNASIGTTWSWTNPFTQKVADVASFFSASGGATTSTLTLANSGNGSVVSSPTGINCGSTCSMVINNGTSVTLTATPNSGYTTAWSNCGGTTSGNVCTLTVNANTTVSVSFSPPDTQPPSVPTNLQATAISSSQISLTWSPSTDNVGVTGYKVYRGGVQIGTSPTTSYTDGGLNPSTQYTYTVSAYDAAGNNSSQSASASATTQASGGGGGSGSWSNILASSRAINWGTAGLPATLPDGETTPNPWTPPVRTYCKTVNPSGQTDGTDVTNISNAIAGCSPGTYVLLAPGTFNIPTSLYIYGHNEVTVRGSGPMSTTLNVTGNNIFIQMGGSSGAGQGTLTSDSNFSPGATSVKIGSVTSANLLTVGNLAWFTQCDTGFSGNPCTGSHVDNGGLFICGLDSACDLSGGTDSLPEFQMQMVRITAVTNNGDGTYTVNFSPGLYMPNWSYANTAMLNWQDPSYIAVGNGLEDATVKLQYGQNEDIGIGPAYASWIKGLRIIGRAAYRDVSVGGRSKSGLVMNNYVYSQDPTSLNDADTIAINNGSDSDDLIMNNLVQGGIVDEGEGSDEGDVIAYNYNRDSQTSYPQNSEFQHSAGSAFILLEGNQIGEAEDDDTWGTHSMNTWFRNYISCWDPPYQTTVNFRGINIGSFARFDNVVGNAIGSGECGTYQGQAYSTIFYVDSRGDPLAMASLMRWGNYDTATAGVRWCGNSSDPGWSTTCGGTSEVPTTLSGNAAPFDNSVPSTQALPCSFFLQGYSSTNCTPHPSGGTGLSWWKVCMGWSTFPTNCSATQIPAFPAAGPDVSGGQNIGGYAYNIPAALAYQSLPIDTSYQNSYSITGSSWSGGTETLTISGLPGGTHIMGGFQVSGSNCATAGAGTATGAEVLMTGSNNSGAGTVSYALASNPGSCSGGTFKFPDIREFNEAVYENDPSSGGGGDTTPPTISISSPSNGATVSSTITVSGIASDNVAVSSVSLSIDGGSYQSVSGTTNWNYSLNTASLSNGSHTLVAKATDSSGNTGISGTVTITVNNASPDVTPPSVPTGLAASNITTSTISLAWTQSTDPTVNGQTTSGLAGYRIYRGGVQVGTSTTNSFTNTGLTPSTTYSYTISAYDNAGNASAQSSGINATTGNPADTTPPTTSITSPLNNATVSSTITVTASASDNVGVVKVEFYVDNVLQSNDTVSPYTFSLNTNSLTNGTHSLMTKAYDAAGNIGSSGNVSVTVANVPQTLTASLLATPLTGTAPVTVSLTASALGTAQGTINYIFYCNRSDTGTNVTSPADLTVNATNQNPYVATNLCSYQTAGTYTTKVIVERGSAPPAEAQQVIVVSAPITSTSTPPLISSVTVSQITDTSAQVVIVTTGTSSLQLNYGTNTSYGMTTSASPELTTTFVNLTGLTQSTIYHFDVAATVLGSSTPITSGDFSFTTQATQTSGGGGGGTSGGGGSGGGGSSGGGGGGGGYTAPFTVGMVIVTSTPTTAKIMVTNSLPALTQVFYGTSLFYGSSTQQSPILATSYFNLAGLTPGKTYDVKAVSLGAGTTISSPNLTFIPGGTVSTPPITTPPPSSGSSLPLFTRNLTIGSVGSDVKELQILLNQWGFTIAKTGSGSPGNESTYFGSLTAKAVAEYQAANGISPTSGFVGSLTRASLNQKIGGGTTTPVVTTPSPTTTSGSITTNLAPGDAGPQVDTLQSILVTDGYLAPQYVTGYYGSLTEQAVEAFQTKEGIVSYGTPSTTGYGAVGPKTRGELTSL